MKKQLVGTTALVAAGLFAMAPGAQAAEPLTMTVGGYFEQWFGWANNNDDGFEDSNFSQDTELHFDASTTLDNGLKVRAHIEIEGNTSGDQIDENYFVLSGAFGQILLGSENSASYKMQFQGDQGVGVPINTGDVPYWIDTGVLGRGAGLFRTPFGSTNVEVDGSVNDSRRITYFTPRVNGFQFGVSYAPDPDQDVNAPGDQTKVITNIVNVGANYKQSFEDVSVGLAGGWGIGEKPDGNAGNDPQTVSFGVNLGFGGFTIAGSYANAFDAIVQKAVPGVDVVVDRSGNTAIKAVAAAGAVSNEAEGYDIGASYVDGPWKFGASYYHGERDGLIANPGEDEYDAVSLGVAYTLGPGVKLRASLGHASFEAESGQAGESGNSGSWLVGAFTLGF